MIDTSENLIIMTQDKHKSGSIQSKRDIRKDHILELYGIPLVRLSTIGSNEKKVVEDKLSEILHITQ